MTCQEAIINKKLFTLDPTHSDTISLGEKENDGKETSNTFWKCPAAAIPYSGPSVTRTYAINSGRMNGKAKRQRHE